MTTTRRASLIAGLLYLITFVSIPTLTLYGPVRSADFLSGVASDGAVRLGAILEVVVALAGIGTAVALYPVIRRYQPQLALGFLASRTLEASMIFTGVVSLLSVVGLRAGSAGADSRSLVAPAHLLIGQYDLAFLLGQSLMPGINALLLGSLLYRARLVPRVLPLIGRRSESAALREIVRGCLVVRLLGVKIARSGEIRGGRAVSSVGFARSGEIVELGPGQTDKDGVYAGIHHPRSRGAGRRSRLAAGQRGLRRPGPSATGIP